LDAIANLGIIYSINAAAENLSIHGNIPLRYPQLINRLPA
jgi:hypothetical protein